MFTGFETEQNPPWHYQEYQPFGNTELQNQVYRYTVV